MNKSIRLISHLISSIISYSRFPINSDPLWRPWVDLLSEVEGLSQPQEADVVADGAIVEVLMGDDLGNLALLIITKQWFRNISACLM